MNWYHTSLLSFAKVSPFILPFKVPQYLLHSLRLQSILYIPLYLLAVFSFSSVYIPITGDKIEESSNSGHSKLQVFPYRVQWRHSIIQEVILFFRRVYCVSKPHIAILLATTIRKLINSICISMPSLKPLNKTWKAWKNDSCLIDFKTHLEKSHKAPSTQNTKPLTS